MPSFIGWVQAKNQIDTLHIISTKIENVIKYFSAEKESSSYLDNTDQSQKSNTFNHEINTKREGS